MCSLELKIGKSILAFHVWWKQTNRINVLGNRTGCTNFMNFPSGFPFRVVAIGDFIASCTEWIFDERDSNDQYIDCIGYLILTA